MDPLNSSPVDQDRFPPVSAPPSSCSSPSSYASFAAYPPTRPSSTPSSKSKPTRERPHRRATVDALCSLAGPKVKMSHRPSLPLLGKSVQFSSRSEVIVVDPSHSKTWYTYADHKRFRRERVPDVVSFREQSRQNKSSSARQQSKPSPTNLHCPVGLEQLLSARSVLECHSNRRAVTRSVLTKQDRQKRRGLRDPDGIAAASIGLSADAFESAQERGRFQEMTKFV